MKAIVVTDQAAGTAGTRLVERPESAAANNDPVEDPFLPTLTVRMMRRRIGPLLLRSTSYRVDESGIWMGNDQTENLFRWSGIDRVDELPGLLIARLGRGGFCAMPIADLPPEQAATVTAFVRGRYHKSGHRPALRPAALSPTVLPPTGTRKCCWNGKMLPTIAQRP
jgi:hypothetical protein